jgi:hypothetical protein
MDPVQALRHLRALLSPAAFTDDVAALHATLREANALIDKALPRQGKAKAAAARARELNASIVSGMRSIR